MNRSTESLFKKGLGLANTQTRLDRLYGGRHRFDIANDPKGGLAVTLELRSPAPAEQVRRLVAHAERGCHSSQSLQARVPVRLVARLNGDDLEPDDKEP